MKNRTKIFLILSVVVIFGLTATVLAACIGRHEYTEDIEKCGAWTSTTKRILSADFHSSLPDAETVSQYGKDCKYFYREALLGDPNFLISVELAMPDKERFDREISRLEAIFGEADRCDDIRVYHFKGVTADLTAYFDDEIRDGSFYNFEYAAADDRTLTITVVNARIWDYMKAPELEDDLAYMKQMCGLFDDCE